MYYGKKKAITISIVVVLLVVILAIGGLILYLTTDLLKSNQTLFFKYTADQYNQLVTATTSMQLQEIQNAQKQMPYETNAKMTFSYQDGNGESIEELEKLGVNIIAREDNLNNKEYSNIKIDYANNNLIDIHYAKSNNIYALKWEDIVLNYFIGIENASLKEFAKKLGIQDTTNIPDEIKEVDYLEIFEITQQEKEHILQTYMNAILESISSEKYTKQKDMTILKNGVNYNTTAYRLDLSAEEIKNIKISLLGTLNQDSITLNLIATKAKLLGLSNEYTTISELTGKIQETINNISSQQVDNSKGVSIVVYEYKGQTVQTEVILKNEMKISISSERKDGVQTINIVINNLSEEQEYNTINMNIVKNLSKNSTTINTNIDNKQKIEVTAENIGTIADGNIQTTVGISVQNENGEKILVNCNAQTTYGSLTQQIPDLNNTNCVVLNNYASQDLNNLITSIIQRVSYVLGQKVTILGMGTEQEILPEI